MVDIYDHANTDKEDYQGQTIGRWNIMCKTEDFNKTAYAMNQTIAEVYFQFVKDNNLRDIPEQNFHPRVTSKIRWEDLDDDNSNHSRKSRNSFASF